VYTLDTERLRAAQPTHTVFNGVHNGMVANPLAAKPGERVRMFVLNVGPEQDLELPHRRHDLRPRVDRGQPRQQLRGMQTVLLGSSNSAVVEYFIPGGRLLHHGRPPLRQRVAGRDRPGVDRGQAAGPGPRAPQHAGLGDADRPDAVAGKLAFESKCLACHSLGQGKKLGPDLAGVTKHREAPGSRAG
jgi:nitrite reductase (NO-forming)